MEIMFIINLKKLLKLRIFLYQFNLIRKQRLKAQIVINLTLFHMWIVNRLILMLLLYRKLILMIMLVIFLEPLLVYLKLKMTLFILC
jgi:hypothetical protein